MKSFRLALALQVALWAVAAAGSPAPVVDLEARLAAAVARGDVDPGRADLYRLYALLDAGRLPAELRVDVAAAPGAQREGTAALAAPQMRILRCGTMVLRAVKAGIPRMAPADQAEALRLLEPLQRAAARAASRVAGKTVRHVLRNWVTTENFSIEWGDGLTNEDGSTPVRDDDADGVPDVIQRWASYFEAAFRAEVVDQGFSNPAFDGALIPVYIANSDSDAAYGLSSGTYALTTEADPVPTILVNNDFHFVPPNDEGGSGLAKIAGAMKVTAAHEFFHVIQFAMPLPPSWVDAYDDWWLEASSVWMEDEVFDGVNDYYQYFGSPGWADFVEFGLPVPNFLSDPHGTPRAYGDVIFSKYLSEHVGGRASMKAVWDLIRGGRRILFGNALETSIKDGALSAYAMQEGFSGLPQLFLGFAAANATMDYREGDAYRLTPAQAVPVRGSSLSEDSAAVPMLPVPHFLGATYLMKQGGSGAPVRVQLSGTPATQWGLAFSLDRAEGYPIALGVLDSGGAPSITASSVAPGDTVYAILCFLDASATPSGYSTAASSPAASDTSPPGTAALAAGYPLARAGGFDLAWTPPGDAAGHVVRWRAAGQAVPWRTRTFFGPVTSAEIRGVSPGSYDVQVFAYDEAGNADPAAAEIVEIAVSEPGGDAPTPPARIVGKGNTPVPGGGGGGGCFLRSLDDRGQR